MITTEEIRIASKVLCRIQDLKYYLTKERFVNIAKAKHNMEERDSEKLFELFGNCPSLLWKVETPIDEYRNKDVLLAVEIAEEVHDTLVNGPYNLYGRSDYDYPGAAEERRRYYYIDVRKYGDEYWRVPRKDMDIKSIDIDINLSSDFLTLAELIKQDGIKILDSVKKLGDLEVMEGSKSVKIPYYDGDIVFVYGKKSDSYSYFSDREDMGVYVATEKEGFRKLLYVPKRGYVDRNGDLEYEDDGHWSEYKISGSGKNFKIVGNIHKDMSVLVDGRSKKKEAEDEDADE